ncbi:hypothetical protein [Phytohabitans kaempferiae]|uniref:Uncharacterized protein n=1 Tax=Phytohabitans kaempferiae TaxID=1620943 RepID=A0ABV6M8S5_9ACTN
MLPIQLPGNADAEGDRQALAKTSDRSLTIEVETRFLFVADERPGEGFRAFIHRPPDVATREEKVALPEVISGVLQNLPGEQGRVEDADSVWRLMAELERRFGERLDPDKLEPGRPSQPLGEILDGLGFEVDDAAAGALIGPTPEGEPSRLHGHITAPSATESLAEVLADVAEHTWRDESTGMPVKERLLDGLTFGQAVAEDARERFNKDGLVPSDRVLGAVGGFMALLYSHSSALAASIIEPEALPKRHNAALSRMAMVTFWAQLPIWMRMHLLLNADRIFDLFARMFVQTDPGYAERLEEVVDSGAGQYLIWRAGDPWYAARIDDGVGVEEYFVAPLNGREISQQATFGGMTEWLEMDTNDGRLAEPVGLLEIRSYGDKWPTVAQFREYVERIGRVTREAYQKAAAHPVPLHDEPLPQPGPVPADADADVGTLIGYQALELVASGDLDAAMRLISGTSQQFTPEHAGRWGSRLVVLAEHELADGPAPAMGDDLERLGTTLLNRWIDAVVDAPTWRDAADLWVDTGELFSSDTESVAAGDLRGRLHQRRARESSAEVTNRIDALKELFYLARARVDRQALDFLAESDPDNRVEQLSWLTDRVGVASITRLLLWTEGISPSESELSALEEARRGQVEGAAPARARTALVVAGLAASRAPEPSRRLAEFATDLVMPLVNAALAQDDPTRAHDDLRRVGGYLTGPGKALLPYVAARLVAQNLDAAADPTGATSTTRRNALIGLLAPGHGEQVARLLTAPDPADRQDALRQLVAAVPPARYEDLLPLLDSVDLNESGQRDVELVRAIAALAGGDSDRARRIVGETAASLDGPARATWTGFLDRRIRPAGIAASALSELIVDSGIDDWLAAPTWAQSRDAFAALANILRQAVGDTRSRAFDRVAELSGRQTDDDRASATQSVFEFSRSRLHDEAYRYLTEPDPQARRQLFLDLLVNPAVSDLSQLTKLARGVDRVEAEQLDVALLTIVVDKAAEDGTTTDIDIEHRLLLVWAGAPTQVTSDHPVLQALAASAHEPTARAARWVSMTITEIAGGDPDSSKAGTTAAQPKPVRSELAEFLDPAPEPAPEPTPRVGRAVSPDDQLLTRVFGLDAAPTELAYRPVQPDPAAAFDVRSITHALLDAADGGPPAADRAKRADSLDRLAGHLGVTRAELPSIGYLAVRAYGVDGVTVARLAAAQRALAELSRDPDTRQLVGEPAVERLLAATRADEEGTGPTIRLIRALELAAQAPAEPGTATELATRYEQSARLLRESVTVDPIDVDGRVWWLGDDAPPQIPAAEGHLVVAYAADADLVPAGWLVPGGAALLAQIGAAVRGALDDDPLPIRLVPVTDRPVDGAGRRAELADLDRRLGLELSMSDPVDRNTLPRPSVSSAAGTESSLGQPWTSDEVGWSPVAPDGTALTVVGETLPDGQVRQVAGRLVTPDTFAILDPATGADIYQLSRGTDRFGNQTWTGDALSPADVRHFYRVAREIGWTSADSRWEQARHRLKRAIGRRTPQDKAWEFVQWLVREGQRVRDDFLLSHHGVYQATVGGRQVLVRAEVDAAGHIVRALRPLPVDEALLRAGLTWLVNDLTQAGWQVRHGPGEQITVESRRIGVNVYSETDTSAFLDAHNAMLERA